MSKKPRPVPAVFFDRDGTLIEDVPYCADPAKVRLYKGVPEALAKLKKRGFRNVMITNQSGIGRGYFTFVQFHEVQTRVVELLGRDLLDAAYCCPDTPDVPSERRKPAPGMVLEAAQDLGIDLKRSWFIGDKTIDVECGNNAGTRSILVRTGEGAKADPSGAAFVANDLAAAVQFILEHSDASP